MIILQNIDVLKSNIFSTVTLVEENKTEEN